MKSAWKLCAIMFLVTSLVAQTGTAPKPKKTKPATITAADVQALKDAIASQQAALAAQQQQIQELRDELHHKDQAVGQAQAAATDAASKADAAQAQAAQQQQAVGELKTDVADLKTNVTNTAVTVQETQKNVNAALESPSAIHFKGITITPGGFAAAEFVRRSRALASDINTPFNSLTMPGASQSSIPEFFGSGRQSRISMLAEGRLTNVKLSGYYEADFLSAGVTSNNNESNSYTLRQRQAFGQAAFNNGWSITGGQMWSLATETKHGMDNRTEATPMTIDPQYTVGFSWARQYGLRLVKGFNDKVWFGVSMENAQATVTTHNNGDNFLVGSQGTSGGLYNAGSSASSSGTASNLANYSFNPSPDIIAKVAFEPGFGPSILLSRVNGVSPRVILVTSPRPKAGKTTTVANLGISLAEIGRRVLLIDGDLRRPRLGKLFGLQFATGLSDALLDEGRGTTPLDSVIRPSTVPGLYVLPGGSEPANISRLLHSTHLDSLIEMARAEYDFVLIDSPPMMGMADARLLSRNADGVILISRAGETSPEQLGEARERLADDGTPVIGTILNGCDLRIEDPSYVNHYNSYAGAARG